MGATASRSDKNLQDDIETFEASMLLTKRSIQWDDESSVAAHSALNALRNAQYHIKSGRRGRGLRAAAASKLICTGRLASPTVVSIDVVAMDITSRKCLPLKLSGPMSGVRTGQCSPVIPPKEEPDCDVSIHSSAMKRSPSSSSSICSLDDTLPRVPASWLAHCPEFSVPVTADACKTFHKRASHKSFHELSHDQTFHKRASHKSSHELSHDLEAAQVCPFDQESDEAFDLCDILTSGGRPAPSKAHAESAHELGDHEPEFDISDILTSGGQCLTHQVTRSRSGTF
jgi:hypothetical protein